MRRGIFALTLLAAPADADIGMGAIGAGAIGTGDIGAGAIGIAAPVADTGCPDWPDDGNLRALFWAENIDGAGNATLTDLDPITTWVDLGTLGQDLSGPGSGGDPAFKATCINGRPCAHFDGGDRVARAVAETAYRWLHDGSPSTVYTAGKGDGPRVHSGNFVTTVVGGVGFFHVWRDINSTFQLQGMAGVGGPFSGARWQSVLPNDSWPRSTWDLLASRYEAGSGPSGEDGQAFLLGAGIDGPWSNHSSPQAIDPSGALAIGASADGSSALIGDIYAVAIYAAAHDATTRADVQDKIECHLGTSLPVSP